MDCFCLFTFYIGILSVMVEVHRIRHIRRAQPTKVGKARVSTSNSLPSLSPSSSASKDLSNGSSEQINGNASKPIMPSFLSRTKQSLLGTKGSDLANEDNTDLAKKESPTGKLKLALVSPDMNPNESAVSLTRVHQTHLAVRTVDRRILDITLSQPLHYFDPAHRFEALRDTLTCKLH